MAGLKEIKRRVRSVQNSSKITYAMKLVSAAKLRKVQEAVQSFRAYARELNKLVADAQDSIAGSDFQDALLETRNEVRKVAVVVIGGQRGLCGGYNSALHKKTELFLRELEGKGVTFDLYVLGRKPAEFFRRVKRPTVITFEELAENAATWPIAKVTEMVKASFLEGAVDEVHLVYTNFKSAISVTPTLERLLPLGTQDIASSTEEVQLKFEPTPEVVLRALLPRVVETKVRNACLNAKASETASRMTAMDAATRNAKQLAKRLRILANKLRQQRITAELLDIIGGAEAVR